MKTRILAIPMVAIAFALSACSVQSDTTKNTNTGESEQQAVLPGSTEYAHVEDLKDALVAEGFPCPEWEQSDVVSFAATSGSCDDTSVLSVFLSDSAKEEVIQNQKALNDLGGHLVVGKNWILNTPDAEAWAEKLGAMPVTW